MLQKQAKRLNNNNPSSYIGTWPRGHNHRRRRDNYQPDLEAQENGQRHCRLETFRAHLQGNQRRRIREAAAIWL